MVLYAENITVSIICLDHFHNELEIDINYLISVFSMLLCLLYALTISIEREIDIKLPDFTFL